MAVNKVIRSKDLINEVKKGTTIITAEPFAFVLSEKHRKERCDNCFKSGKTSRCSGCQFVYYCSRNCQKKAWSIHKVECPNIKKVHPRVLPDAARMMARIIIKLNQNGKDERGYYTSTKYRTFHDMMSHVTDIKNDLKKMEHFTSLSMVLFEFLPKDMMPDIKELLGIFGRMSVNSFNILDSDMTSLGVGIYLGPSIIDHSCNPNASAVFEGTTLIIRNLSDFPSLDWSKVRISYIDLLRDTEMRRAELRKAYYFICDCERCNTPETIEIAAACPNKKCTYPCMPSESKCFKCGEKFPDNFEDKFDQVSDLLTYHLEKMAHTAYLDASRMCLKKQEGILHPYNLLSVRMLEMALTAAMDLELWEEAETYASSLAPKYLFYFGEMHPMSGQVHFYQAKLLSLQGKNKSAFDCITIAEKIMNVTFGENHSKMKNEVKPLIEQLLNEYRISRTLVANEQDLSR